MLTGGQLLGRCLENLGVREIWGTSGHSNVAAIDGLLDTKIRYLSVRHEQVAAHAADGYFRAVHRPGVILVHNGPGLTNALTGIGDAASDCSAVVVIAGDVALRHEGRDAFQEISLHADASQGETFRPLVKRAWRVHTLEALPRVLAPTLLIVGGRDGPVIAIYPGPLLPNYQIARLGEEQLDEILALVERIGLPAMDDEIDDSAAANVADATTEVVTYWDESGMHRYSVYALGIDPSPSNQATAATIELVDTLSTSRFAGDTEVFAGDRVRVIASVSRVAPDPEFEDIRPWPLEGEDPNLWTELELSFTCTVLGPDVLALFEDATQVTQWLHPVETMDAPPFLLQVRPLHPGEPDCPPHE